MFPSITAAYAALLALVLTLLSSWVIAGRVSLKVLNGDGNQSTLSRRIRSQANFTEYVPLALLLIAFYEASGGNKVVVQSLDGLLLLARVAHPFGMVAPDGSRRQAIFRGVGALATLVIMTVAAILLLIRVL